MSQARRRVAKAEREIGPIRFEADVVDDELLDQVIDLKRAQYQATGARDYFADTRRIAMARRILHTRDADFGGVLSAVYAGDRLLAAHFGMRASGVLHWWFPVYDPAFSALAPGWILLRELVSPHLKWVYIGSTSAAARTTTSGGPRPARRPCARDTSRPARSGWPRAGRRRG